MEKRRDELLKLNSTPSFNKKKKRKERKKEGAGEKEKEKERKKGEEKLCGNICCVVL